ncbi:phage GP46 family protein [Commensalibacter melissae]|uniref:phage GP46 family protein n=1 Tax=Commensalibacter TaxID=1079922 RepID=UPI000EFCEA8D|nr:phage GP46 family protein [Commensalibacter melissae]AYN86305.1 hypothetical protein D9V35_01720 [Commensalibacter melissae]
MRPVQDISITWNNKTGKGEWSILDNDIKLDNALFSAVMVSLFTDRLAPLEPSFTEKKSNIGKVSGDRRGWWGDIFRDEPMGSRLWQLRRAVKTDQYSVTLSAQDMIYESLQWMVNDGLVANIDVNVQWVKTGLLQFSINLTEPQSDTPQQFLFSWVWEGI